MYLERQPQIGVCVHKYSEKKNMSIRPVKKVLHAKPTMEGAGVRLDRAFQYDGVTDLDPFLLLDDFRNENPAHYLNGFPWHPHRGIETITYVLAGSVEHGDSIGNQGIIEPGDIQWMTAGKGILHQEMPRGDAGGSMHGFQLWANLPASLKMTDPRYQEVKSKDIPEIIDDDATKVRIICGDFWGKRGPVDGIAANPTYLDVSVAPGKKKTFPMDTRSQAFAYVIAGSGSFENASDAMQMPTDIIGTQKSKVENKSLVMFDWGDEVSVQSYDEGIRFLLISGRPLREPVAWHGPIVMNTQEELKQAFTELNDGSFLKK